jgi:predicted transcriptional regulator
MARAESAGKSPHEVKKSHKAADTIYIASKKRDVPDREAQLRAVRTTYGLTSSEFAAIAEVPIGSYGKVESNSVRKPSNENINKIVTAVGEIAHEDDPNALAVITTLTAVNLPTDKLANIKEFTDSARFTGEIIFTKDKKQETTDADALHQVSEADDERLYREHEGLTFGESLDSLRQSFGLSLKDFAEEMEISLTHLRNMRQGRYGSDLPGINRIIENCAIESESRTAQLLRLKARGMQPLTQKKVNDASPGTYVRYLRTLKGYTTVDLGKALYRTEAHIIDIEIRRKTPKWVPIEIPKALGIEPDEPAYQILKHKIHSPDQPIQEKILETLVHGKLLFVPDKE